MVGEDVSEADLHTVPVRKSLEIGTESYFPLLVGFLCASSTHEKYFEWKGLTIAINVVDLEGVARSHIAWFVEKVDANY
jgi:hypothetical protein